DIGMPQECLNTPQVGAAFDQVRRKCVPQDMRRELCRIYTGFDGELLQHLMTTPPRKMSRRSSGTKQVFPRGRPDGPWQKSLANRNVLSDGLPGRLIERRHAFFATLSLDQEE